PSVGRGTVIGAWPISGNPHTRQDTAIGGLRCPCWHLTAWTMFPAGAAACSINEARLTVESGESDGGAQPCAPLCGPFCGPGGGPSRPMPPPPDTMPVGGPLRYGWLSSEGGPSGFTADSQAIESGSASPDAGGGPSAANASC